MSNSHFEAAIGNRATRIRSWLVPFVAGGGAFLAGYIVVALAIIVDINHVLTPRGLAGYGGFDKPGLLYYNAHFVGTSEGFVLFGESHIVPLNGLTLPFIGYLMIPVVVLIAAGFLTVRFQQPIQLSHGMAFLSGAKVATGYAAFALVGIGVFSHYLIWPGQGPLMQPNVGETILLMGLVYPIVLGGIGGLIAADLHLRRERS